MLFCIVVLTVTFIVSTVTGYIPGISRTLSRHACYIFFSITYFQYINCTISCECHTGRLMYSTFPCTSHEWRRLLSQ